jgi:hypothetical protein
LEVERAMPTLTVVSCALAEPNTPNPAKTTTNTIHRNARMVTPQPSAYSPRGLFAA